MKVSEQMIKEFTESFDYVRVFFEKTRLSKKKKSGKQIMGRLPQV